MPGKLFTYIAVRPNAAPLVPQSPDPHLGRLSMSENTLHHVMGWNGGFSGEVITMHDKEKLHIYPSKSFISFI
jgi:hypothetical protein